MCCVWGSLFCNGQAVLFWGDSVHHHTIISKKGFRFMKKSISAQVLQTAIVLLGTLICGLGIQLELFSGAGVDPLTMFEEGMGRTLGTATGNVALAGAGFSD